MVGRVFLSGYAAPNDIANSESVMSIKPGDSGVVIGDQVDEFTGNWSAEHFIVQSYIYFCFVGEVFMLIHFLFILACEDYSFLDQTVWDFKHGLDSILTDSINIPELDASFGEADAVLPSISSGFLWLVSTPSDILWPQVTPSIKSI